MELIDWSWLQQNLQNNEVFIGIVAASLIGTVFYLSRNVPKQIWKIICLYFSTELQIHNNDESFRWFQRWLSNHNYASRSRRLFLESFPDGDQDKWVLVPGTGMHLFWHQNHFIYLERERQNEKGFRDPPESFTVRIFGPNSRLIAKQISDESYHISHDPNYLRVISSNGMGNRLTKRLKRPLNSLVLKNGQIDDIVNDIEWFNKNLEWYARCGIPYRRGFLLYGPPGTGKSSLVLALASYFELDVVAINLPSVRDDNMLEDCFSSISKKTIVLLEDIDAVDFTSERKPQKEDGENRVDSVDRDNDQSDNKHIQGKDKSENQDINISISGLSLSGILNVLDGVASEDGRITIMTSNHPDNLDSALLRPGRIDRKFYLGLADRDMAYRLFLNFFPKQYGDAEIFSKEIPEQQYSMAELQNLLLTYSSDLNSLLDSDLTNLLEKERLH